jgi:hypothetical protein
MLYYRIVIRLAFSYNVHFQPPVGAPHCMPFYIQHAIHMAADYLNPGANSLAGMRENPATQSLPSPTIVLYFKLMTTRMEQYSSYNKDHLPFLRILCTRCINSMYNGKAMSVHVSLPNLFI